MPAEYALLQLALPDRPVRNVGVLFFEPSTGELDYSLREKWDDIADREDADVLRDLDADFRARIEEMGGRAFLKQLEDSLSNTLRITPRRWAGRSTLRQLFTEHVAWQYPVYTLKAAATRFGEEFLPEPGEPDKFIAQVVGKSMEPTIPDGSFCLFRRYPGGSRSGNIYLIERAGESDETIRYSVKRYRSRKHVGEEEWHHLAVMAEPDNAAFESFELREEDRIIAEFVRVIG